MSEGAGAFVVAVQEPRELTINHSVATSHFNYHNTYQQLAQFFKAYQTEHLDMEALHSSPRLKLKKYKEAVYFGEFEGGKRTGKGIMQYQSGQVYEGEWLDDVRQGHGF